jgi:ubiquinone/menaquinone biosynthesis C-methylase UbiE
MEARKREEQEFHDRIRSVQDDIHVSDTRWSRDMEDTIKNNPLWVNMKYYAVERKSREVVVRWFLDHCKGKKVLDYCCGNGDDGVIMANNGAAQVTGIDISEVSIVNCTRRAQEIGKRNLEYQVMDAEAMTFKDRTFDIVTEYGAMHHLNLEKAYREIARVLKPEGHAIFVEALGHNQLIHLYRKLTPELRTEWEADHILKKREIELAKTYFDEVTILGFFHLATLGAVPFRNTRVFPLVLTTLEFFDRVLLSLPIIKWQAWQVVFVLSKPKKITSAK